ncbi:hypothetical protein KKH27_05740 [bacterium]|nr:hypothetical protein [bacterium]MBU1983455.1 hypothetical protein [bacterium]
MSTSDVMSLIAAWVVALSAVIAVIVNVRDYMQRRHDRPARKTRRTRSMALWVLSAVLLVIAIALFVNAYRTGTNNSAAQIAVAPSDTLRRALVIREADSLVSIRQGQPFNMQLTSAAWDAYNHRRYEVAICIADRCIEEFKASADKEQSQLEVAANPLPPVGKVSDTERQAIIARGVLNDFATCLWIRARSAQYLGRPDQAVQDFQATSRYTYARTWDPNGWFWSPSKDALERLSVMK